MKRSIQSSILVLSLTAFSVFAADQSFDSPRAFEKRLAGIRTELEAIYPGARIELMGIMDPSNEIRGESTLQLLQDTGRGEAIISIRDEVGQRNGTLKFSAFQTTLFPTRRILPGESLTPDSVRPATVNVASGMNREIRGLMISASFSFESGVESRQTLLEGQPILSSSIIKRPDIKKGEPVRVRMISGDVTLMTSAQAEEPGYHGNMVRVTTLKNKRTMMGKLEKDGVVEVRL